MVIIYIFLKNTYMEIVNLVWDYIRQFVLVQTMNIFCSNIKVPTTTPSRKNVNIILMIIPTSFNFIILLLKLLLILDVVSLNYTLSISGESSPNIYLRTGCKSFGTSL